MKMQSSFKNWFKTTNVYRKNYIILREFKFFWRKFLAGVVFSIIASIMEGASIALLLTFLRNLSGESEGNSTSGINLIDDLVLGLNEPIQTRLMKISVFLLLATSLRSILMYLGNRNLVQSQINLLKRIRIRIFEKLISLNLSFYTQSKSGDLVSIITTQVDSLRLGTQAIALLINKGVYLPLYLVGLSVISVELALVALAFLLLIPILLIYVRNKVRKTSLSLSQANKLMSSLMVEFVSGIQTILSFSSQDFEKSRFNTANSSISQSLNNQNKWISTVEPLSEFFGFLNIIVLLYLGNSIFKISLSSLLAFIYILLRLIQASRQMNNSVIVVSQLHGPIDSIERFLQTQERYTLVSGKRNFDGIQNSIQFENVSFRYSEGKQIINNLTTYIPKGQTIAFVGSSGSGKSTLVSLLLRLYDPTQGRILLDSVEISEYDLRSLHNRMAIVSQDTFLFNATVRENIAYGLTDIDDYEIISAAKTAFATEFIDNLPNGFDTVLGDRGVRLSGGQRQRIAIARAILRNPDILILDEATSALDNESEKIVQEAINEASRNRTVIVIAHRLSTIQNADKIVVLEQGIIVEEGDYENLLAKQGIFWRLQNYTILQHELIQE